MSYLGWFTFGMLQVCVRELKALRLTKNYEAVIFAKRDGE
jgi:hypothetical protein